MNDRGTTDNPEFQRELTARHERDERLRFALAAARVGVWEWDLSSEGVTWSRTTALAFGVSPDSAPMSGRAFFELIHPDDRHTLAQAANRAIHERTELVTEFRTLAADGSIRWIEAHGRVAYDADGKARRVLGVNIDISDRRRLEEELRQASAHVEVARLNVLKATMRTVQGIVGNALMSLYSFRREVEGLASQPALALFDQTLLDATARLKALGDVDRVVERPMDMGPGIEFPDKPAT